MNRTESIQDSIYNFRRIADRLIYVMAIIDDSSCKQAEKDLLKFELQKIIGE
jgi:hypothetical protein